MSVLSPSEQVISGRPRSGTATAPWPRPAVTEPHQIWAAWFEKLGCQIVPLVRGEKRSAAGIRWSDGISRLPRAHDDYGVVVAPARLVVVDVDRQDATLPDGYDLPATLTVRSGVKSDNGWRGWHAWYRVDRPVGPSRIGAWPGVDLKSSGLVVGPGSHHRSGVIYEPVGDALSVAPAPAWLYEVLGQPTERRYGGTVSLADLPDETYPDSTYRVSRMKALLAAKGQGERESTLSWCLATCLSEPLVGTVSEADLREFVTIAIEELGLPRDEAEACLRRKLRL